MSDNNNVENDNESDYVYLKRPYLFNIRYNSRQVWNKLPDEEKAPYVNYEEDFEDDGYGEGFDLDEAYGEPEYLSEDDFDDRIDNGQEDSE